jgi:hypothetical protein
MQTKMRSVIPLKVGEGVYLKTFSNLNRWGDYSATVVDVDDKHFWTIQEYAATPVGSGDGSGRWGTWWGNIQVAIPFNDNFGSALSISGSSGFATSTVLRASIKINEPAHAGVRLGSIWFTWTAPASGAVTFNTLQSAAALDTVLAVYTGTTITNLTEVGQSRHPTTSFILHRAPSGSAVFVATNNVTYRIAVLGHPNDYGETHLTWNQSVMVYFVKHPFPATNEVIHGYERTLTGYAIGEPVTGATSTNYTIISMTSADEGSYVMVASNSSGPVSSDATYVDYFAEGTQNLAEFGAYWTNNVFNLPLQHVQGYEYIVYGSTNLTDWVPVQTNVVPWTFTNAYSTNYYHRFFKTEFIP